MKLRMGRITCNVALLLGFLAWGIWLIGQHRSKLDYLVSRVVGQIPVCSWVPMHSENVATLGFSHEKKRAWSSRETALVSFRVPALPNGAFATFDVTSLAAHSATIHLVGSHETIQAEKANKLQLKIPASRTSRILSFAVKSTYMKAPTRRDRRWLGIAITRLRVCPASGWSNHSISGSHGSPSKESRSDSNKTP